MAVHVRYKQFYISLPLSAKKMRNDTSAYFGRVIFSYFHLELNASTTYSASGSSEIDRRKQIYTTAKFEDKISIYFLLGVAHDQNISADED